MSLCDEGSIRELEFIMKEQIDIELERSGESDQIHSMWTVNPSYDENDLFREWVKTFSYKGYVLKKREGLGYFICKPHVVFEDLLAPKSDKKVRIFIKEHTENGVIERELCSETVNE